MDATDCAGNVGSEETEFEFRLCLVEGKEVIVKPESLKSNDGKLTVFVYLPEICAAQPSDGSLTTPADILVTSINSGLSANPVEVNYAAGNRKLVLKVVRSELGDDSEIGTAFVGEGTATGVGFESTFEGGDTVKKNPPGKKK